MTRMMVAAWVTIAVLGTALAAFSWPLSDDTGYAAYRAGPCDKCVPGVKPARSVSKWIVTPTTMQRDAQRPWLRIRVNGRDTDLGRHAVVLDKELMAPVTAAEVFGLTATRSPMNHQLLTLSGGPREVHLRIGSRQAALGDAPVCLPVALKWHNGKVYMPLESIGKLLGWQFAFNALTGVLSVDTRVVEAPAAVEAPAPAPASAPAPAPVVGVQVEAAAAAQNGPTLKIVNKSDKYLDVRLEDPGRNTTLWSVPPNEVREADALRHGPGSYQVTVSARAAAAGPRRMTYDFEPRRAYTMTVTVPR